MQGIRTISENLTGQVYNEISQVWVKPHGWAELSAFHVVHGGEGNSYLIYQEWLVWYAVEAQKSAQKHYGQG
jgi:hypothetical protein